MPVVSYTPRAAYNDKSSLTDGWHPAFLLAITDEEKPATWNNVKEYPRIWRWVFAVWDTPVVVLQETPERQTAASEQKFMPAGKLPNGGVRSASKAYAWHVSLLGRQIQPGESVNLDPLMPLPCRVKVERAGEYTNIKDVDQWPEGQVMLAQEPALVAGLRTLLERPGTAPPRETAPSVPVPAHPPGMQAWGSPGAPAPQGTLPGTPAPTSPW